MYPLRTFSPSSFSVAFDPHLELLNGKSGGALAITGGADDVCMTLPAGPIELERFSSLEVDEELPS